MSRMANPERVIYRAGSLTLSVRPISACQVSNPERVIQHEALWPEVPLDTIEASFQPIVPNQPFVKQIKHWSGIVRNVSEIFFWKFQDKNIPGWFLDITDYSWLQIQSAMRTCGHEWFRRRNVFVLVSNCQKPKEQREQSQACLSYAESRLRKTKSIARNLSEIFFALCRKGMWRGVTLHGNNPFRVWYSARYMQPKGRVRDPTL